MIKTRGCHPPQSIWPSIGVGGRQAIPYLCFLGKELHHVAGWDREAKAFAGHRMLARGNPTHLVCQLLFLYIRRELFQRGRRVDTPAHVIHARVSRLAQHDAVVIVFVPGFHIQATLPLALRFDQAQNLGVVSDRGVHFADADRYMPRTQHTIDCHGLPSLTARRTLSGPWPEILAEVSLPLIYLT